MHAVQFNCFQDIYNLTPAKVQDREILPEGVGDFPVLHFLPVFDFISHFYQLFLVSCLLKSGYVILIILLVINFSNKSPNKKKLVIGSVSMS
jgi:hypothetical protein